MNVSASGSATRRRVALLIPAIAIITAFSVLPLAVVVIYSFLTPADYGGVVWSPSIQGWFSVLWERDIFDDTLSLSQAHVVILGRSIILASATTLLTLLFGLPTAWFIATRSPRSRGIWMLLITIPFWTNLLVRTIAIQEMIRAQGIVNSFLLWTGAVEAPLQMMFTNFAILLGMTYVFLPLMVLPVYTAVERFDFGQAEAAYDLYASRLVCLRRVILPAVKPGIIAGSILVFVPSLGSYVTPRLMGGGTTMMIGNLIDLQFGQGRNWPLGAALSVTLTVIVMLALLVYVRAVTPKKDRRHG